MEVNDRKTTGHPFNTSCYKTIKSDIKEDKKLMLKKKYEWFICDKCHNSKRHKIATLI